MDEIVDLHPIFGEYDLIAKIEVQDIDELTAVMLQEIRHISGILNTKTLASVPLIWITCLYPPVKWQDKQRDPGDRYGSPNAPQWTDDLLGPFL